MELNKFSIVSDDILLTALKKIDFNNKGFLVVVNKDNQVVGTLTDGDIRRAFIRGVSIDATIVGIYNSNFKYINKADGFSKVVENFKKGSVAFLPIVDDEMNLLNIITKKNMHVLLLHDINFDFHYNFLEIDDSLMEHEIYDRPWGFYKTAILNQYFQSKTIVLSPMSSLSLQEHRRREEHWIVVHGEGKAQVGESVVTLAAGSYLFIPKGCKHQLTNTSSEETLIIAEVQLGDYFGEDDIIRYADIYGRVVSSASEDIDASAKNLASV